MKQVILKTPISGADLVKQINENDTQLFNKIEEDSLSVEINDDLSYLTDQRVSVQGYIDI